MERPSDHLDSVANYYRGIDQLAIAELLKDASALMQQLGDQGTPQRLGQIIRVIENTPTIEPETVIEFDADPKTEAIRLKIIGALIEISRERVNIGSILVPTVAEKIRQAVSGLIEEDTPLASLLIPNERFRSRMNGLSRPHRKGYYVTALSDELDQARRGINVHVLGRYNSAFGVLLRANQITVSDLLTTPKESLLEVGGVGQPLLDFALTIVK